MLTQSKQFSTKAPHKSLTFLLKKKSGRDVTGQVSMRHQGGRQKRFMRVIDFKRDKIDMLATVLTVEYDPNRNCHIALVEYADGEKRYIIHPEGLKVGATVRSGAGSEIAVGNTLPLEYIPVGIEIHNIELHQGQGAKAVRSAGAFATILARDGGFVQVKLASGELRRFSSACSATVGRVGNIVHKDRIIGKAGTKRLMGIRPTVRGTAQDPRSHPHGGGEGRSGEGMHPKTPWGKQARGVRTRNRKKASNKFIISRRRK